MDMITTEKLCDEISHGTTLISADIKAVLIALSEKILSHLEMGDKIKLDDLGIFKIAFSGKGKREKSEVTARDIENIHIPFTPETKLKRKIKGFRFGRMDV